MLISEIIIYLSIYANQLHCILIIFSAKLFQYDITLVNIPNLIKILSHFLLKVYMFVFYMPGGSERFD